MNELNDQTVDLIVTGPPYYSPLTEQKLDCGIDKTANLDELDQEVQAYAWTLRDVFEEANRVLRDGGRMVVQTRDVRLRQVLSPVESIHRQLIEATGLRLYTRYFGIPLHQSLTRRRLSDSLAKQYGPLSQDPEVFLVFIKPGPIEQNQAELQGADSIERALHHSSPRNNKSRHRYQAPLGVIKALIRCYSQPGDLVLDLFAGGGTTLVAARELGRRVIGYEIDPDALALTRINLAIACQPHCQQGRASPKDLSRL